MLKILSIGNSFSQDATRYLHGIAEADGEEIKIVNLCKGGCSLEMHYQYMRDNAKKYGFELDGEITGIEVSLGEVLDSDDKWDFVTFQQVSHLSMKYSSYQPYLNELSQYIKHRMPKAKQVLHQTWGYADNCKLLHDYGLPYSCQKDMFTDIKLAYERAAKEIQADGIIPAGETMRNLYMVEAESAYRDGSHVSYGIGRYALGLIWYAYFTGNSPERNNFRAFDCELTEKQIRTAQWAAAKAAE